MNDAHAEEPIGLTPVVAAGATPPIHRVMAPDAVPNVAVDAAGVITQDVACKACGYNVRGRMLRDLCPECGCPVIRSACGGMLRFCEPAWVLKLADGMKWALIGVAAMVVAVIALMVLGAILGAAGAGNMSWFFAGGAAMQFVAACLLVFGFWLVTSPDPASSTSEKPNSARRVARAGLLAMLIATPLQAAMNDPAAFMNQTGKLTAVQQIMMLLLMISMVAQVVGYAGLFKHVASLAARIPHASLLAHTRINMWGYCITQSLGLLMVPFTFMIMPSMLRGAAAPGGPTFSPWFLVFGGVGCIVGLGGLTFGIWSLILMIRFRIEFKRAASQALHTWASNSSSDSQDDVAGATM